MPCPSSRRGWLWVFLEETTRNTVQRSELLWRIWQCWCNDECWWELALFVPGMFLSKINFRFPFSGFANICSFFHRSWNQQKRNKSTSTVAWAQADPSLLRESKRSKKEIIRAFPCAAGSGGDRTPDHDILSRHIYPHTRVYAAAIRTTSKGPYVSDVRTKAESTTTAANLVTCKKKQKEKEDTPNSPSPSSFIPPCQFQRRRTVLRAECLVFFFLSLFSFSFYYLEGIHKYFVIPKGVGLFLFSIFIDHFFLFLVSFSFSLLCFFLPFFETEEEGKATGCIWCLSAACFLFYSNLPVSVMPNKRNEHVSCVLNSAAGFYY